MTSRATVCASSTHISPTFRCTLETSSDIRNQYSAHLHSFREIGQILRLGNFTDKKTYNFLCSPNLPFSKAVTHRSLRIGFTHGHTIISQGDSDSLLITARQMDVDVLVWGGIQMLFVKPSGWWADPIPSFCLMDVQGSVLVLHVYQPRADEKGAEPVS
ncbi:hypothetical protein L211DRAFT_855333 [Terfezia boudieri ATCC MYA-4762]|uniref:Uncharacterized protein n=1 Tax=Terfezia boudieri ATCC MYA-4762 TaxID=1051890 RepID=A0A3N4LZT2_9PEZI|nr:hypothetical protein L211DRAFT_855333 [Terfezia boudieri ATCC MYA-4762]